MQIKTIATSLCLSAALFAPMVVPGVAQARHKSHHKMARHHMMARHHKMAHHHMSKMKMKKM